MSNSEFRNLIFQASTELIIVQDSEKIPVDCAKRILKDLFNIVSEINKRTSDE